MSDKRPGAPTDRSRRRFVSGVGAAAFSLGPLVNATPKPDTKRRPTVEQPRILAGNAIDLAIGYRNVNFTGRERIATTINGSTPPNLPWIFVCDAL